MLNIENNEHSLLRSVAEEIKGETMGHWKDGFLYESTNR